MAPHTIVEIVGARPQFVKLAPCSRAIRARSELREVIIHTGQHYDYEMSQRFFEELILPAPDHHLGVGSGPHGAQTGAMLARTEELLLSLRPDAVLVFGDTNSTLAGALAGAKLHVPVAHVEAGLRSFDRRMPEEINRILVDHLSALLFCPTPAAVENLRREGITEGVQLVGDVMKDLLLAWGTRDPEPAPILSRYGVERGEYLFVTVHRAENTENAEFLEHLLTLLADTEEPVIFPAHPRSRKLLENSRWFHRLSIDNDEGPIRLLVPLPYGDTLLLVKHARKVLTDSGGLQKEALLLGTPCLTLRDETEWVETLAGGWNRLVGGDRAKIIEGLASPRPTVPPDPALYGDGDAAGGIARVLVETLGRTPTLPAGRDVRKGSAP